MEREDLKEAHDPVAYHGQIYTFMQISCKSFADPHVFSIIVPIHPITPCQAAIAAVKAVAEVGRQHPAPGPWGKSDKQDTCTVVEKDKWIQKLSET